MNSRRRLRSESQPADANLQYRQPRREKFLGYAAITTIAPTSVASGLQRRNHVYRCKVVSRGGIRTPNPQIKRTSGGHPMASVRCHSLEKWHLTRATRTVRSAACCALVCQLVCQVPLRPTAEPGKYTHRLMTGLASSAIVLGPCQTTANPSC